MSSATPTQTAPAAYDVVVLRIVLLVVGVACLMEFWHGNAHTEEFRLRSPLYTPPLWNLYLSFKLAGVVAVIGMWNWRRWGLRLLTVMAIATLFTEIYVTETYSAAFLLTTVRIPLVLAAVWFLTQRVGDRFR